MEVFYEQYEAFVNHIQNFHNISYKEPCVDPLVPTDCKEEIPVDLVKQEPISGKDEGSDGSVKMETSFGQESLKTEPTEGSFSEIEQSQNDDDITSQDNSSDEDDNKDRTYSKRFNPTFYKNNPHTSIFIELYKKAPCLWDPNDENYKNNDTRANCQREIICEMKKRCKIILTHHTLRNCCRKLYTYYQTAALDIKDNAEDLPVIVLDYFEKCSFLSVAIDETPKRFNPTFYRDNPDTVTFIELYKAAPSLWDPNDINYDNIVVRENCQKEIIEQMEKRCQLTLPIQVVQAGFRKLYLQYNATRQAKEKKTKLRNFSAMVLEFYERCSFLSVAKDDFAQPAPEPSNSLSFAKLNTATLAFLETYARFPMLYDSKHPDYSKLGGRKQTYNEMSIILKNEYNVDFNEDEVYKGIDYLRHWYYKLKARLDNDLNMRALSSAARTYVEKCSFLPARGFKEKFKCSVCDKILYSEGTRKAHLFKKHNIGDWPYKCNECGRSFEYNTTLLMHKQRAHMEKGIQCKFCDRTFSVRVDLQRHLDTHTGQKPYVCELCGKGLRTKRQLGYHFDAIHTKIRAFKCTMCPKDFLKASDLKDHIKAHLNIRDKICETCGKGFTNSNGLIRHRQLHAPVKKYACKLCDARFYQFVGLNSHMKHRHSIVKRQHKTELL